VAACTRLGGGGVDGSGPDVAGMPDNSPSPPPLIKAEVPFITIRGVEYSTDLTELDLRSRWGLDGLTNNEIEPLKYMVNLTRLVLSENQISDISPLSGLTNLLVLDLSFNHQISDISPLAGLTNLQQLCLNGNFQISDISPLSGLTNLLVLEMEGHQISDISPLSGLTNLLVLDLRGDGFSDISALSSLVNLRELLICFYMMTDWEAREQIEELRKTVPHCNVTY
jgi:internalin A